MSGHLNFVLLPSLSHISVIFSVAKLCVFPSKIIDLDMKRNRNREALNALKSGMCSEKVKICFGNMFIKFPKSQATQMIQKDQEQLDSELNHLRKGLKANVNHLNEKQGKPELSGYNLLPLSADEMKAIKSVLKR
ncbi:p53 and DNA damage-regulated protein 1 isoform X2 [Hippocampus comes]|uniref:p53 and DNA damage-regulated protein 1 isoform X2 n=1 Tax=Hippocampus comes TaxID=109280 RepID=UPI00094E3EF8|nr:PREDICTED: p53 and DNA damage-regulated protein 1 isoform X2 [Hippocampus comes]